MFEAGDAVEIAHDGRDRRQGDQQLLGRRAAPGAGPAVRGGARGPAARQRGGHPPRLFRPGVAARIQSAWDAGDADRGVGRDAGGGRGGPAARRPRPGPRRPQPARRAGAAARGGQPRRARRDRATPPRRRVLARDKSLDDQVADLQAKISAAATVGDALKQEAKALAAKCWANKRADLDGARGQVRRIVGALMDNGAQDAGHRHRRHRRGEVQKIRAGPAGGQLDLEHGELPGQGRAAGRGRPSPPRAPTRRPRLARRQHRQDRAGAADAPGPGGHRLQADRPRAGGHRPDAHGLLPRRHRRRG